MNLLASFERAASGQSLVYLSASELLPVLATYGNKCSLSAIVTGCLPFAFHRAANVGRENLLEKERARLSW